MTERLFGTDGIRGIPGHFPLSSEVVERIGWVTGSLLSQTPCPQRVLLGTDSRASGVSLSKALARGFQRARWEVHHLGILPTPALAYLTPQRQAGLGAVISASHNPPEFNGIKFFSQEGLKLHESVELRIEKKLLNSSGQRLPAPSGSWERRETEASRDYLDFLLSTFPPTLHLDSLRLILDCAHGSAYRVAPLLFRRLGATVFPLGVKPNGKNINQGCGSLQTNPLRQKTFLYKADLGIALDGDADRVILCDEKGKIYDGDELLALASLYLLEQGRLKGNRVVVTVMANLGLIKLLQKHGIEPVQVPVGDRHVSDAVRRCGASLGGESSGHLIFSEYLLTGDGLLTALQILAILRRTGRLLSSFRRIFPHYPQILKNVKVLHKIPLQEMPGLQKAIHKAEKKLKSEGRVLVRYSGTEPLARILVEGPSPKLVRHLTAEIEEAFKKELNHTKESAP